MQHARSCCMQHIASHSLRASSKDACCSMKLLYATRSVCEAALCKNARTQLKLLYATRTEAALYGNTRTQLLNATHTRRCSMDSTYTHTSLRSCSTLCHTDAALCNTHTQLLDGQHVHTYQLAQLLYATQKPKRPAECGLRAKRSEAISIQFTCFTGTKSTNTPFQYTFLCPEGEAL